MKSIIKSFLLIAVAAVTVFSCTKEIDVKIVGEPEPSHRVSIRVSSVDTKTVINEGISSASFKWSSDDASRFYLKENAVEGTDIEISSDDSYETITIGATFATESAASYTYSGFLAKNMTAGKKPRVPATQTSTASAYDPDADVLVAKPLDFGSPQDELELQFTRPVVINKMTLKGLTPDETVSKVVISSDKKFTGYYDPSTHTWSGDGSEITVNTSQVVPASGKVDVYFVSMPVDAATLTVSAETEDYTYSKTFGSTINLVLNRVTVFGVSSLTKKAKLDYSGTYVITNAAGTKMANVWASGNNLPAVDVTLEGGVIYYNPDAVTLSSAQVTLTKITDSESTYYGMYTIIQNSKYLYAAAASSNYLKGEDSPDVNAYWDVSCTDGNWSIVASKSSNRNVMQNNGNLFACYGAASQTAVALYGTAANVKPTPVITANNINIDSDAVESTNTGVTFNSNTSSVASAAYNDEGLTEASSWLSTSVTGTTVYYAATENTTGSTRVGYIKITATNSDSRNVIKTISVTQAAAASSDVEVLNEEFDNTSSSDSSSTISSSTFPNFNGTTQKAYKSQYGGIKFGTSSASGFITSKALDLSSSFTVKLNVKQYSSDTGRVQGTVGEVTKEITPTSVDTQYTLEFEAATDASTVKIGTSSKRAYIDNVIIIRHD